MGQPRLELNNWNACRTELLFTQHTANIGVLNGTSLAQIGMGLKKWQFLPIQARVMANYSAKILNSAVSGLSAQQAVIAATANNIANVNTAGYSRRLVNLETRSVSSNSAGINVGDGVDVVGITRMVNVYLEKILKDSQSDQFGYQIQSDIMKRVEPLFTLDGSQQTIGSTMTAFFTAVNDLSADPASIELRENLIQRVDDVVSAIKTTYQTIANLQAECDQRIETEVAAVNSLTSQIAELNGRITAREGGAGDVAADERDQREALLNQLSEKIGFNSVELPDGSVTLTLNGGFAIVSGTTARELEVTHSPSFAAGTLPPSLSGGTLSYIVYDYDPGAGSAHVDLTEKMMENGGIIGGLLTMRGYADPAETSAFAATGPLVEIATQVEAITRTLLTMVNVTYRGPNEEADPAQPWKFSTADLDGNGPDVYGLFTFDYSATQDVNGDGIANDLDLTTGITNYSSILAGTLTDPRRVAAARDPDPALGLQIFGSGNGKNMEVLAALQTDNSLTFSAGPTYSFTGTFGEIYDSTVVKVGNLASSAEGNMNAADRYKLTIQSQRDAVSSVSLDEEFSNLIRYQRAYQASARLIRIADQLLEQLVSII